MLAPALLSCVYDHENADVVYIIPDTCTGYIDFVCTEGDYPADTSFRVIYEQGVVPSEFHSGECSIEQVGEFELAIHISWSAKPRLNEQGVGKSFHDCDDMTPPLAAGTWTIHHGTGNTTLEIPSTQVDTACTFSYDKYAGLSCAEVVWGE
jgi:hypothetical protein